jgi:hypothetical protein
MVQDDGRADFVPTGDKNKVKDRDRTYIEN